MRSTRVLIHGRDLRVSAHAADRWWERVKPMLTREEAPEDLRRVLSMAGVYQDRRPEWATEAQGGLTHWIVIGDAIAFPVKDGVVMTCVTRGFPSDETRELVTELQRKRRAKKGARGGREKHGKVARRAGYEARRAREAFDG